MIFYAFLLSIYPPSTWWIAGKQNYRGFKSQINLIFGASISHKLFVFSFLGLCPRRYIITTSCITMPTPIRYVKVSRLTESNLIIPILINDLYVLYNNTF